jgi:hypothetical protein
MQVEHDLLGGGNPHHHSVGPGTAVLQALGNIGTNIHQQQHPPQSADLLDSPLLAAPTSTTGAPPPHQQQQQQLLIQPNNAQTLITVTTTTTAPEIAGLGRINPSAQPPSQHAPKRKVIRIPTYSCNGGLDVKFNPSPRYARPTHLHNLLTPQEYESTIEELNSRIKRYRMKGVDKALLAAGPLLVPLALWGARHSRQVKKRKVEIERAVSDFNERMDMENKNVRMFWNRATMGGGGESYLTIEEVEAGSGNGKRGKLD